MSSDSESISDSDIEISEKTLLQDGDVSKCQDELIFDPFNPTYVVFRTHVTVSSE